MPARLKICGIRSPTDLRVAVDAGADAIGLICGITHVSEDALTPDQARDLQRQVPPFVSTVLVTHLAAPSEVLELARYIGVDTIQLHGLMSRQAAAQVKAEAGGRRVIKTVHVLDSDAVTEAIAMRDACDAVLLDSRTEDRLGGTGQTHDWSISRQITDRLSASSDRPLPVILAGGLTPENVSLAIEAVRPFAVDVNSGVEDDSSSKDPGRCVAFASRAREALRAATAAAYHGGYSSFRLDRSG
jgi:phosphoribosylanthranilate isomerase